MEDEVERRGLAVLLGDTGLEVLEELGAQDDVARLVDAVDVAEGGGQQVAALLAQAEGLGGADRVVDGGVQLVVDLVADAVLLAAGRGDLDLKDDLGGDGLGEQLLADGQVVGQGLGGAVPHVRLEERVQTAGHALGGDVEQRTYVAVQLVLRAVVRVQGDRDVVLGGHDVRELGQGDRAGDHVLVVLATQELRTTGGDLDDAVALGLREAAQGSVQGLGGGHIDGRVGELACLRPVEHLVVDLGGCDGHLPAPWMCGECAYCGP